MAKTSKSYSCSSCGIVTNKWAGRCDGCGDWNTLQESKAFSNGPQKISIGNEKGEKVSLSDLSPNHEYLSYSKSGIAEFDRVLGNGLVSSSAILLSGDPGIGKSTILLQAAAKFGLAGLKVLYISGEEAASQVQLRAERLGLSTAPIRLGSETNLRNILTTFEDEKPDLVIIDSIQTIWADTVDSAPGSVSQVRSAAFELTNYAKRTGTAVIMVGHVTKEGQIAGPRVVEHMVDTVLHFEGERGHQFRILRAVKNRFGPVDEIGVFEMVTDGLAQVKNPSELFLSERGKNIPGSVVFAGIEGTRPILVEFQALVTPSTLSQPRRNVIGWDGNRLSMILAVLESRCGISFANFDVYLNIAGGIKINEPAADLAVAGAIFSAREEVIFPVNSVVFGEISLSGAVRQVSQVDSRLKEAQKLGFIEAITATRSKKNLINGINIRETNNLRDFVRVMQKYKGTAEVLGDGKP